MCDVCGHELSKADAYDRNGNKVYSAGDCLNCRRTEKVKDVLGSQDT